MDDKPFHKTNNIVNHAWKKLFNLQISIKYWTLFDEQFTGMSSKTWFLNGSSVARK